MDTCSAFVESRLLVTSFLRTVLRRGRPVFCTGFSEGEPWSHERVPGLYPFPFLGKPLTYVGLVVLTMPHHTFACAGRDDLLPGMLQLGSDGTWFSSRFRD